MNIKNGVLKFRTPEAAMLPEAVNSQADAWSLVLRSIWRLTFGTAIAFCHECQHRHLPTPLRHGTCGRAANLSSGRNVLRGMTRACYFGAGANFNMARGPRL